MTEAQGNNPEISQEELIDPIGYMRAYYLDLHTRNQRLTGELKTVEAEWAEAVKLAAEPFAPRIQELSSELQQIEAHTSEEVGRERIEELLENCSPLYKATLEILVANRYNELGVAGLLRDLKYTHRSTDKSVLETINNKLNGILGLEKALSGISGRVPVAVYGKQSYEILDEQKQWDGEPAGTGIYQTNVYGYVGYANPESLIIETERQLLPDQFGYIQRPTAIILKLEDAKVFYLKPNWTVANFNQIVDLDHTTSINLASRNHEQRRIELPIEWKNADVRPDQELRVVIGQEEIDKIQPSPSRSTQRI
ncbi:MAG: hypothetical protein ACXWLH_03040 [Candidatus Saccharimonadales bacterium]